MIGYDTQLCYSKGHILQLGAHQRPRRIGSQSALKVRQYAAGYINPTSLWCLTYFYFR
jgi:hypothetical protein